MEPQLLPARGQPGPPPGHVLQAGGGRHAALQEDGGEQQVHSDSLQVCLHRKLGLISSKPSRFPLHQGFSEGWGLYSETLGYEFGLYDDPLVRLEDI